jgi:hypothetical protein
MGGDDAFTTSAKCGNVLTHNLGIGFSTPMAQVFSPKANIFHYCSHLGIPYGSIAVHLHAMVPLMGSESENRKETPAQRAPFRPLLLARSLPTVLIPRAI